ncbi:hypothetical protein CEXT_314711 [Caerostris extrusa]|uniref:Uncharacterized protein n=1 Tax=Caerostris extrusa TaxID=172846 RepID=A0AAV4QM13_CAEEX|nr:hypothetical protein CEXT_314711 [Caerostris extrusa]
MDTSPDIAPGRYWTLLSRNFIFQACIRPGQYSSWQILRMMNGYQSRYSPGSNLKTLLSRNFHLLGINPDFVSLMLPEGRALS